MRRLGCAGINHATALRWFADVGGVVSNAPRAAVGPLPVLGRAGGDRDRVGRGSVDPAIAAGLGRAPSTVSREVARNRGWRGSYRAGAAEDKAITRARRPKTAKLAACDRLRAVVQAGLDRRFSPEQIARRLQADFPDDEADAGVATRRSTSRCTCRAAARCAGSWPRACAPGGRCAGPAAAPVERRAPRSPPMVKISERPAEADDRAVPGHWEGDLIIGIRRPVRDRHPGRTQPPGSACCCTCPTATTRRAVRDAHASTHPDPARRTCAAP